MVRALGINFESALTIEDICCLRLELCVCSLLPTVQYEEHGLCNYLQRGPSKDAGKRSMSREKTGVG